ncbi:MAG TPA: prenyltransferase, partial [Gammaproteobacteria bacterium]|nr:prenyltransferase [Gammaproteobacteria bacterium]
FVAYVATGIWHLYLADGKRSDLVAFWPMVERAIDYVLNQQAPEGEIYWAVDSVKGVSRDALVTGCSSIYKSIQCALNMANV